MARSSQSLPTSRIVLMRQTQIIFALLVAGDLVDCGSNPMDGLLQLHRVMQLEPQIERAMRATNKTESRRQVVEASEMSVNYALPREEQQTPQYYIPQYRQHPDNQDNLQNIQKIIYTIVPQDSQTQNQEDQNNQYYTHEQTNNPYYTQEQQSYAPVAFTYQQYMEQSEENPEPQREPIQQKYVQQYDQKDTKPQTHTTLRYLPLQFLINNLVDPMPPSIMATMKYEKQPIKPVYHYAPVPKGTFQNTKFRSDYKDERIKETRTNEPSVEVESIKDDDGSYPDDQSTYDFGYRVTDGERGVEMGKMETKMNGVTKGSYHVLLPDGRLQIVNYWSDHTGYHTDITYKSKN